MPKPQPQSNPIQAAVSSWLSAVAPPDHADPAAWKQKLRDHAPKRFTIYEPMALLPPGSFAHPAWTEELGRHDAAAADSLWALILEHLSRVGGPAARATHLAVSEGIPARTPDGAGENVTRSPGGGLRLLRGDFGPAACDDPPSERDFQRAFWVSTRQNGIWQTWAPRWTMFSRGNVKEKARLLGFPPAGEGDSNGGGGGDGDGDGGVWAVDLYAGIGYFAFCYARLGMRVLCWELNPWSVEALRRGARLNRWTVGVFGRPGRGLPSEDVASSSARIVVLWEDNRAAGWRADELRRSGGGWLRCVRHVNCGLLPTSRPTWRCALSLTRTTTAAARGGQAWLHLHENVGDGETRRRRDEVEALLRGYDADDADDAVPGPGRAIRVLAVEKVKTYAPGVWHCVFDVHVTREV
ncbi:uncharacterized protein UV8b_06160 [Ustilaginoidea virens]|uniref:tRNA wybutosine-synthesizing protein 2 n=1 Tax=Ustilaginoidea virens TaxID=1159556 RepID=A0A8E5HUN2_USTVR|nr:uncharacterized protein UV8b_06160 [Ustilaginoidea virens]QUC21919.1 hypothetical protein UV8b_06160 [Ustilaginoidea virens]